MDEPSHGVLERRGTEGMAVGGRRDITERKYGKSPVDYYKKWVKGELVFVWMPKKFTGSTQWTES